MGEPVSRLPQVRKIQEVKDFRAAAAERQEISVRTLGGIRKKAEAETLQRLCEKYQAFLSDDEIGLGPEIRKAMSTECRAALRATCERIERITAAVCVAMHAQITAEIAAAETILAEIRALLDKLRPIRKHQEGRIEKVSRLLSDPTISHDNTVIESLGLLQEFLGEMQKAKAVHAEIDSIIEQGQISQMEEQRKAFEDEPFLIETVMTQTSRAWGQSMKECQILPCPFCAGQAKLMECMGEHWVHCTVCECDTRFFVNSGSAVEMWNRRAAPAAMHGGKA